jgi:hypothetical protein
MQSVPAGAVALCASLLLALLAGCGQHRLSLLPAGPPAAAGSGSARDAGDVPAAGVRQGEAQAGCPEVPAMSALWESLGGAGLAAYPAASTPEDVAGTPSAPRADRDELAGPAVWGLAGLRVYPYGERTGPNGVEYDQLFALDLDLNLWLWRSQGLYVFAESQFWGQKPGIGITNANQGAFDFSKREFDFDLGAAWNYYGPLEARAFAYSFNNLNRGTSLAKPAGFDDGVGLENRYYLAGAYADVDTPQFDLARATFVSVGYFPTKEMVDTDGIVFQPGPFARAYLTLDLDADKLYLFEDGQFIGRRDFRAELLHSDAGLAVRPLTRLPRLEFRAGVENDWDLLTRDLQTSFYGAGRLIF